MTEKWYQKGWRPLAAYVYLAICVFDFIIGPVYMEFLHRNSVRELVQQVTMVTDPNVQIALVNKITTIQSWVPLTTSAGGMLHLAFGALLTTASWSRGKEKIEQMKSFKDSISPDSKSE